MFACSTDMTWRKAATKVQVVVVQGDVSTELQPATCILSKVKLSHAHHALCIGIADLMQEIWLLDRGRRH